jgi:SAM-dependent methyltransferase
MSVASATACFSALEHDSLDRLNDALGCAARDGARSALAALGIRGPEDVVAALSSAGIAAHFAPLVRRWASYPAEQTAPSFADIRAFAPESAALIDYVERSAQALLPLLREEVSPFDLYLFDDGGRVARFLYTESPLARACNGALGALLAELVDGPILEVGAGTGGTARTLVPLCRGRAYVASDIAPSFVARLKKEFSTSANVSTLRYDIDEPPPSPGTYAAVIAANCLHGAKDVAQAARHLRASLVPNGGLLAWEATRPQPWFDATLAFIQGWQKDGVAIEPLKSRDEWRALLSGAGFQSVDMIPGEAASHGQTIIVAR